MAKSKTKRPGLAPPFARRRPGGINQNTKISQLIPLWNQLGSRVIRGNLPSWFRSKTRCSMSRPFISARKPASCRSLSGSLPPMADRVVMEETLPGALAALFKESAPGAPFPLPGPPTAATPARPVDSSSTRVRPFEQKLHRELTICRAEVDAYAAGESIGATRTSFLFTNSWMPMLESSRP